MTSIYTIGHSNMSLVQFATNLLKNGINLVVDVRTFPRSRWCPHFNRQTLEHHLGLLDIGYVWKGLNLGGKADNIDFDKNIQWLVDQARTGQNVAIMCSEKSYLRCHRYSIIEPALIKSGVYVQHIESGGKTDRLL